MNNFKTLPNNTYKVRFPWQQVNSHNLLSNFLENGGLVDDAGLILTPKTDKASQIPTSAVVHSSHVGKHDQNSPLDGGFVDTLKHKNTDNIIPFFLTNLGDHNIDNRHFFTAHRGLRKSAFFDDYRSELEQYQPIHAVVNSNVDNHVEGNADTVISRTIVEVSKNPETQLDETKVKDNLTVVFAETLQNNSELDLFDIYGIVDQALRDSYDYLSKFRFDPEYSQKLETAFGTDFNREVADKLFNNFADGNFTDIPTIKIVNCAAIHGGNGAFSADTGLVYLSVEFLNDNYNNSSKITDVLLEETGHFVDAQINEIDSPGDEGDIFSELVQGNTLTNEELQALKTENDIITVVRNGQEITTIRNNGSITLENNNTNVLRVATWNIYGGNGNSSNPSSFEDRLKAISQLGSSHEIDVIVLQEVLTSKLDSETEINKLITIINNATSNKYNIKYVANEYSQTDSKLWYSTTNTGYLVLYSKSTTQATNIGFYKPGDNAWKSGYQVTYQSGINGNNQPITITGEVSYRPPIKLDITKNGQTYSLFTWHNEAVGKSKDEWTVVPGKTPASNASIAALTSFNNLVTNDASINKNSMVLLGDLNVSSKQLAQQTLFTNNTLEAFNMNKKGQANDFIFAGLSQNIQPYNIPYTLKSDAHYPVFADIFSDIPNIDNISGKKRNADEFNTGNTQIKKGKYFNQSSSTTTTTSSSLADSTNTQIMSWENQLLYLGDNNDNVFNPLIIVDGGKVEVSKDANGKEWIYVKKDTSGKNPKIYAAQGNNGDSPLFVGEMKLDPNNLAAQISDLGPDSDPDYTIGGFEVKLIDLAFVDDHLEMQGSVTLPGELGGLEVAVKVDFQTGSNNKILLGIPGSEIIPSGQTTPITLGDYGVTVTGGSLKLPGTKKFNALGLIEIQATNASLNFDFQEQTATLHGVFGIPSLKNAQLNLNEGNYIQVKKTATGLDYSMKAEVSVSPKDADDKDIPIFEFQGWKIDQGLLSADYDSTRTDPKQNKFKATAKLTSPKQKKLNVDVNFNGNGSLETIKLTNNRTEENKLPDFSGFGVELYMDTLEFLSDFEPNSGETWDPELRLQGTISVPNFSQELTGRINNLKVNRNGISLNGASLALKKEIKLGTWTLHDVTASYDGTQNKFAGKAKLQTAAGEDIDLTLVFDSNGLQNITASNINFHLFGAKVSGATISFTPDRNGGTYDWDPQFTFAGSIALGGISVTTDQLLVNSQGFELGNAVINIGDRNFKLLGLLNVQAKGLQLAYRLEGSEKVFIITGTLILTDLYNLTSDFSGSNYIKISSSGDVQVVGKISADEIKLGAWKLKYVEVGIDTTKKQVEAKATLVIPSGIEIGANIGFKNGVLDFVKLEADHLNKPIGTTGAYLQRIKGEFYYDPTKLSADMEITAGPKIDLNLPSWLGGGIHGYLLDLDLHGEITANYLKADGNIRVLGGLITGHGEVTLDWNKGYLWAESDFNILYGLIKTQTQFLADSKSNIYMFGEATVNVPTVIPGIRGWKLGSGEVYFEYTNDGNSHNDYVAAWGNVTLFGTVGIKVYLDGNYHVIWYDEAKAIADHARTTIEAKHKELLGGNKAPTYVIGDGQQNVSGNNGTNINGTDGNDTLHGDDNPNTINGKKGNDLLLGEGGSDFLYGNENDDVLNGGGGSDSLYGGDGNDHLYGEDDNDLLEGGANNDYLNGGTGDDTLKGGSGDDYLYAGDNNGVKNSIDQLYNSLDQLYGEDGNDTLHGAKEVIEVKKDPIEPGEFYVIVESYRDIQDYYDIVGEYGKTSIISPIVYEILDGGTGNDTAAYSQNNTGVKADLKDSRASYYLQKYDQRRAFDPDPLIENFYYQAVQTLTNIENLIGSSYGDILIGDSKNNIIEGGEGNDTLTGGLGADTFVFNGISEGLGADTFVFNGISEGIDTITDFNSSQGDKIQIDISQFGPISLDQFTYDKTTGVLSYKIFDFASRIENYNGKRYLLSNVGTWEQVQALAQSVGGNLVTINDQNEQDWLVNTFGGSEDFWIGLTDKTTEGTFQWVNSETSSYRNWYLGEPNNAGNEDYVEMNFNAAGKWNNANGVTPLRGIIEINSHNNYITNFPFFKSQPLITLSNKPDFNISRRTDLNLSISINTQSSDFQISGEYAEIFEYRYSGKSLKLIPGRYDYDTLLRNGFDKDILSSLKVPQGWAVALYKDNNFNNLSGIFTTDSNSLGDNANNSTDSLIVFDKITEGTAGNDTLYGINILNDNPLDDDDNSLLKGRADNDTYIVFDNIADTIIENPGEGTDTVESSVTFSIANIANVENLTLTGTGAINGTGNAANNVITGNAGNNILDGGDGNDTLIGGPGNDTLNGGAGENTADYSSATQGINVTLGASGFATNDGFGYQDSLTGIDHIIGSQYNDIIVGDDYWNNILNGGAGNDYLNGLGGNDTLIGGADNDTLDGGLGTDTLIGGLGNDTYIVDSTTDTITENANEGTDTIQSSVFFSLANLTNVENLTLTGTAAINGTGNAGNNVITGNAGNNILDGGAGIDSLIGGAGNDVLNPGYNQGATDTVDGGSDTDTLQVDYSSKTDGGGIHLGHQNTNHIWNRNGGQILVNVSNVENYNITGTQYADVFEGRSGNDIFNGGADNDNLYGGYGNDLLTGGLGKDALTGGLETDRFDYRNLADSLLNNFDVITDFNANEDKFVVSNPLSEFFSAFFVTTLDVNSISGILTSTDFQANAAARFQLLSFGFGFKNRTTRTRTFVAINDGIAGFDANTDAIIEVTGLTGTLGLNNFTTTLA